MWITNCISWQYTCYIYVYDWLSLIHMAEPDNRSTPIIAAPGDDSMYEMSSGNESSTYEATLGNLPIVNDGGSSTSGVEEENHSVANEIQSENPSTTNITSTSTRLGFITLPPEIRVLVFRHLLLERRPLSTYWLLAAYQTSPAIFHTSRQIRQEAFQVLYGENTFYIGAMHPRLSILNDPQIRDTIQNVHFDVRLNDSSPDRRRSTFINMIREFGSPTIVRNTLNLIFRVAPHHNNLLYWFGRALPRFTNFRSIRCEFLPSSAHSLAASNCPVLCNIYNGILTPIFGPAGSFSDGRGLTFRPQDYLRSLCPELEVDWMESLDGIRLDWNQDPPSSLILERNAGLPGAW